MVIFVISFILDMSTISKDCFVALLVDIVVLDFEVSGFFRRDIMISVLLSEMVIVVIGVAVSFICSSVAMSMISFYIFWVWNR